MRSAALALLLLPTLALAEPPRLDAARATGPLVIDGRLDDLAWAAAVPDDRFTQYYPDEGKPPTERTVLRVLFDDDAVYVGLELLDREPGRVVARLAARDNVVEADRVTVAFDSRGDGTTAYEFTINAAGVLADTLLFDDTNASPNWDAVWDGAVARDERGWSAELRIPLSALRFPPAARQSWGLQVSRTITRRRETDLWSFRRQTDQGVVSRFGRLDGLVGLRPRRTFELRPFIAARIDNRTPGGGAVLGLGRSGRAAGTTRLGLDLKLGVTSELTLDATVNPDFGQVEADAVVLNLSRFETFNAEKRPFFLEGLDLFQTPINLFHSRRIGERAAGLDAGSWVPRAAGDWVEVASAEDAVDIWAAAKLSGKVAHRVTVGCLGAVTGSERVGLPDSEALDLTPPRGFLVGRVRYELGPASYAGLLATSAVRLDGAAHLAADDHDGHAQSVDAQWQSKNGRVRLLGQLALTERVGGPGAQTWEGLPCAGAGCVPLARSDGTVFTRGDLGWGSYAKATYRGELWSMALLERSLSPTFDPNALGFATQFNQHLVQAVLDYTDTRPRGRLQDRGVNFTYYHGLTFDGVTTNSELDVTAAATLRGGSSAYLGFMLTAPGRRDVHETGDGGRLELPPGAGGWIGASTDERRVLRLGAEYWMWWGLGTSERELGLSVVGRWKPRSNLELQLAPDLSLSRDVTRFYFAGDGCHGDDGLPCTPLVARRHYRFAELDSGYLSLTLRGTYTLSPRLSVTGYGQLFFDRGAFSAYRAIDTDGLHPDIARADLVAEPTFAGDNDGDGVKDDDFEDAALNVSLVLRWEFVAGSSLLLVYSRGQAGASLLEGRSPGFRLSPLGEGTTEEILLVKMSLFL